MSCFPQLRHFPEVFCSYMTTLTSFKIRQNFPALSSYSVRVFLRALAISGLRPIMNLCCEGNATLEIVSASEFIRTYSKISDTDYCSHLTDTGTFFDIHGLEKDAHGQSGFSVESSFKMYVTVIWFLHWHRYHCSFTSVFSLWGSCLTLDCQPFMLHLPDS